MATKKPKHLHLTCKRSTVCVWCGRAIRKYQPLVYPSGRRDGQAWHRGCLTGYLAECTP